MRYLTVLLLSLSLWAQTVSYPNAYTGTAVVQAGAPPFSKSTAINTVVRLASPYSNRIALVTNPNLACNGTAPNWYTVPGGGGPGGLVTNPNGTMTAVVTSGNVSCAAGFNESTLQMWPTGNLPAMCPGDGEYSRTYPGKWFCRADANWNLGSFRTDGETIYAAAFAATTGGACGQPTCYDPTNFQWTKAFSITGSCPQVPSGQPKWSTSFGIGPNDSTLSFGASWTGGQDTGRYFFTYNIQTGVCTTIDTIGNGTNPLIYVSNLPGYAIPMLNYMTGNPLQMSFYLHEADVHGSYAWLSYNICTGPDCGSGNGPLLLNMSSWQSGSTNDYPNSSGHDFQSQTLFINYGNPIFWSRPLSNLSSPSNIRTFGCGEDAHFAADATSDSNPAIGTSGKLATTTWTQPDCNELLGLSPDGTWLGRFSPTWSSGSGTNFYGQYAISGVSQDRKVAFFTTDMECGFSSTCGTQVVAVDLTGN